MYNILRRNNLIWFGIKMWEGALLGYLSLGEVGNCSTMMKRRDGMICCFRIFRPSFISEQYFLFGSISCIRYVRGSSCQTNIRIIRGSGLMEGGWGL